MRKFLWLVCILVCMMIIGCLGSLRVGSKGHKATILYFEGGSGKIKRLGDKGAKNKLICRSAHYFHSKGIKIVYIPFNLSHQSSRVKENHFNKIQKSVTRLRTEGHKNIWLMGISNGAISVSYAGEKQIQGVEGLIAINPGASGRYNDFSKIKLPFLLITHEKDGGLNGWSPGVFSDYICPNSIRAKNVIFKGGLVGTSREARGSTQKYQHGLRGLEKEFADAVIEFIFAGSNIPDRPDDR